MKKFFDAYIKRFVYTLVTLALPIICYCILGPLEIYIGNKNDFEFSLGDFFPRFCLKFTLLWVMLSVVIAFLPDILCKAVNFVLFCFGTLSYLQNMFLNKKLSEIDGSPMQWGEMDKTITINTVIWIVLLLMFVALRIIFKKNWKQISMAVTGFLSLIQLAAIVSLLIWAANGVGAISNYQLSSENQFSLASDENIVVLVLDTYGNNRFDYVISEKTELTKGLSDFTYYSNADCHYYCTFPAMTSMFTGVDFDFEAKSSQDWLQAAWSSERADDFFNEIKDCGYSVNLFSADINYVYGTCDNLYGKFTNVMQLQTKVDTKKLDRKLLKMSVYRYAPYRLKPRFEVLTRDFTNIVSVLNQENIVNDNAQFYEQLKKRGLLVDNDMDKAITIQHLSGIHEPCIIDENANTVEMATAEQVAQGLLVIVGEYIQQMKDSGIYDDATIIIMADHGSWEHGDTQPIFLVKEKQETHSEMQTNTAPISLDDFQATILTWLGRDTTAYDTSIYDWNPGDQRERTVYMRWVDKDEPDVEGSAWNTYRGFTYYTDKQELNEKVANDEYVVLPATPW